MSFTARLKVIDDKRLKSLIANTGRKGQDWATETAENILDEARTLMESPKSGKQYPGLPNRSSAPGEAPARQSGDLYESGRAEGRGAAVIVSFDTEYAVHLEVGTSRMAPRPYLRPAYDKEKPKAIRRAREIVEP